MSDYIRLEAMLFALCVVLTVLVLLFWLANNLSDRRNDFPHNATPQSAQPTPLATPSTPSTTAILTESTDMSITIVGSLSTPDEGGRVMKVPFTEPNNSASANEKPESLPMRHWSSFNECGRHTETEAEKDQSWWPFKVNIASMGYGVPLGLCRWGWFWRHGRRFIGPERDLN
ncbi:hypothetical protein NA57DRAFT_59295 [Rhizodiscina lignyota]|uniref:Uncharacterized protein n=1 Tax=Rhizodiscina lignyota TaxID=1504668 RepID=A0A9P4I926_9PEZI|nr:hypothetical protein NA57DRAFT_59295 [Rhizodiscina lignyota]